MNNDLKGLGKLRFRNYCQASIAGKELKRQKAARGSDMLKNKGYYDDISYSEYASPEIVKKVEVEDVFAREKEINAEMEKTLQNIVDLTEKAIGNRYEQASEAVLIKKIAQNALNKPSEFPKPQEPVEKPATDGKSNWFKRGNKPEKKNKYDIGREQFTEAENLAAITGHYQAALEVISAISFSLSPATVSAAADCLLKGSYQLSFNDSGFVETDGCNYRAAKLSEKKNEALLATGMESLTIINREVKDKDIVKYLEEEPSQANLATIAGLYQY